jgi:hypothetical protein
MHACVAPQGVKVNSAAMQCDLRAIRHQGQARSLLIANLQPIHALHLRPVSRFVDRKTSWTSCCSNDFVGKLKNEIVTPPF